MGTNEPSENSSIYNIEDQIELSTQTLERNLGFINNCDNKASIILTAVGVLITIVLTNDGLLRIKDILKCCFSQKAIWDIVYAILFIGSGLLLIVGILILISVLLARLNANGIRGMKNTTSLTYFKDIISISKFSDYKNRFKNMSKTDLLDDLISQIYINADIATKKYRRYNLGLKLTIAGFVLFVVFILIGIYLY